MKIIFRTSGNPENPKGVGMIVLPKEMENRNMEMIERVMTEHAEAYSLKHYRVVLDSEKRPDAPINFWEWD
jgi:hypothetical protein